MSKKVQLTVHTGAPYGNQNHVTHGGYGLKMLARRINDCRTWEWEYFASLCDYLLSGIKEQTPDVVMKVHETGFLKLRLELSKAGFFNKQGGLADEHYLAWSNSFMRALKELDFQWGEGAPSLADYLKRRALEQEPQSHET